MSSRQLPIGAASGPLNSASSHHRHGGVQTRLLSSSSKATPPSAARPSPQSNDKGQDAIEKAEMLHAELNEVSVWCHLCN